MFAISFPSYYDLFCRWKKAIPRANWEPTKASFVCSKHFSDNQVIRSEIVRKSDGSFKVMTLKNPKLVAHAVPHIFPNVEATKKPSTAASKWIKVKNMYRQRHEELRKQIEAKYHINNVSECNLKVSKHLSRGTYI